MVKQSATDIIEFERLLRDAVPIAIGAQRPGPFLDWVREHLDRYVPADSPLQHDVEVRDALSRTLAAELWNAMPLPRRGFLTDPLPKPGRNDPCSCGSGRKYKQCCANLPSLGPFDAALLWPFVLHALRGADRVAALRSPHVPRAAVVEHAADELRAGRAVVAIELLEPMYAAPVRRDDDVAEYGLDVLCDAYDARGRSAGRRKLDLLERIASLPRPSPLRAGAQQRLACIHMDQGRPDAAWYAFQQAQRDDPGNPALGVLEVQLLLSEGRDQQAHERAKFFLAQIRRSGQDLDPHTLEFYERLAADPTRALSDVVLDRPDASGRRLADWLDRVAARPVPTYELEVTDGQGTLATPATLGTVEADWDAVFERDPSLIAGMLPSTDSDPWAPATEDAWSSYLERHPDAFDSLEVLDGLADAALLHPDADQPYLRARLFVPVLERGVAILDAALGGQAGIRLPWSYLENRPGLRMLHRLLLDATTSGRDEDSFKLAARMLELNPDDNHGVRHWLANAWLRIGNAKACLDVVHAYPGDLSPEISFNAALAHYMLGNARSAGEALVAADRAAPRITHFLVTKRVARPTLHEFGVTLDGDDRGWIYREDMRETWLRTPGAMEWAKKVLGKKHKP